jgi:competence/damage-inducible protein CinA-like protein
MPLAEVITIGTEILLGEIVDTNAAYIARALRQSGIDLFHKTSVGDNVQRIAQAIRQSLERCEIIITTGGLGPTVDDPTRDAVALAINAKTEYRPELWEQIQERFQRWGRMPSENNRRQAYIPQGSIPLENQVGTAPCFMVELGSKVIISLPGVPREMEYLMEQTVLPYLHRRYPDSGMLKIRVLHTAGAGESQIDELIGDLETLSNPTVGLAAHSGQIDIRIVAKAQSMTEAEALIRPVEDVLSSRLRKWVYGADEVTLEEVAMQSLAARGWHLAVVEAGLGGALAYRLARSSQSEAIIGCEVIPHSLAQEALYEAIRSYYSLLHADVGLGVTILPGPQRQDIHVVLITPLGEDHFLRTYGGPPKNAGSWAANQSLNILRNINNKENDQIKI